MSTISRASLPTKKRILKVCVRLFLERGYKKTTVADIIHEAGVSASSFQNIFRAKDGVLTELVQFMYSSQFDTARNIVGTKLPPVYIYALETAIQLTLTELNENLREIYTEAYTQLEASSYIHLETSKVLYRTFWRYLPGLTERDFFEMEIGSAGIMRGFMAYPCDEIMSLDDKIHKFLSMSLRAYNVPADEIEKIFQYLGTLDVHTISERVMRQLFHTLAMHYEFSLDGLLGEPNEEQ